MLHPDATIVDIDGVSLRAAIRCSRLRRGPGAATAIAAAAITLAAFRPTAPAGISGIAAAFTAAAASSVATTLSAIARNRGLRAKRHQARDEGEHQA